MGKQIKIAIASDIHLEFGDCFLTNDSNADVLILAGDIMIANTLDRFQSDHAIANRFREFLLRCSQTFPLTIYIAGNHEFYHGKLKKTPEILKKECDKFDNIKFLNSETFVLNDITFIGQTLWTDCNKYDPLTLLSLSSMMYDFKGIVNDEKGYTKFRPAHSAIIHRKHFDYIKNVVAEKSEQKFVVISHHAPSSLSIHPMYVNDTLMNGGYYSDLSEFIMDSPQIKLWVHGHMHNSFDYVIGETRVICNPRGYVGHERNESINPYTLKYVEL
jgi:predicted phosphodiesterase